MAQESKSHSRQNVVQVSFSSSFFQDLDKVVDLKRARNRQDVIRRATQEFVERVLARGGDGHNTDDN